jgi:hypothetical protein
LTGFDHIKSSLFQISNGKMGRLAFLYQAISGGFSEWKQTLRYS